MRKIKWFCSMTICEIIYMCVYTYWEMFYTHVENYKHIYTYICLYYEERIDKAKGILKNECTIRFSA